MYVSVDELCELRSPYKCRDSPFLSDVLPPDNAPNGKAPVGVNPFNCNTDSDSSL